MFYYPRNEHIIILSLIEDHISFQVTNAHVRLVVWTSEAPSYISIFSWSNWNHLRPDFSNSLSFNSDDMSENNAGLLSDCLNNVTFIYCFTKLKFNARDLLKNTLQTKACLTCILTIHRSSKRYHPQRYLLLVTFMQLIQLFHFLLLYEFRDTFCWWCSLTQNVMKGVKLFYDLSIVLWIYAASLNTAWNS